MAYEVLKKEVLNPSVFLLKVNAPLVARKAEPGQFIILRTTAEGERVPFTIEDYDREEGSVTIVVQIVGKTTQELSQIEEGECLHDFAGPLGIPTHIEAGKSYCVIGGGLGTAIAYPQAKKAHELGSKVTTICGFRNTDAIILADEVKAVSDNCIITTDDGSNGLKGLVTERLEELIAAGEKFDEVIAIGPMIMMKFVCKVTEKYGIKTMVSMNPVMIDGTGMCGGCRVIVGGETKFACVDGPDFDGHQIDWDAAMSRSRMFKDYEKRACDEGTCRIGRTNTNA